MTADSSVVIRRACVLVVPEVGFGRLLGELRLTLPKLVEAQVASRFSRAGDADLQCQRSGPARVYWLRSVTVTLLELTA